MFLCNARHSSMFPPTDLLLLSCKKRIFDFCHFFRCLQKRNFWICFLLEEDSCFGFWLWIFSKRIFFWFWTFLCKTALCCLAINQSLHFYWSTLLYVAFLSKPLLSQIDMSDNLMTRTRVTWDNRWELRLFLFLKKKRSMCIFCFFFVYMPSKINNHLWWSVQNRRTR